MTPLTWPFFPESDQSPCFNPYLFYCRVLPLVESVMDYVSELYRYQRSHWKLSAAGGLKHLEGAPLDARLEVRQL